MGEIEPLAGGLIRDGCPGKIEALRRTHGLDLVPKGRDEADRPQFWVRRHDEYAR